MIDEGDKKGSISVVLSVNTEAWTRVAKSFKDFDKALNTGLDSVRPLMEEAARQQSEAFARFKMETLGEWMPSDTYFFAGGSRAGIIIAMEEQRKRSEDQMQAFKDMLNQAEMSFSIACEPVKSLKDLFDEVKNEGLFPELLAQIDLAKKEQTQLHKKKNKKVKNWEHNKFWQGRK